MREGLVALVRQHLTVSRKKSLYKNKICFLLSPGGDEKSPMHFHSRIIFTCSIHEHACALAATAKLNFVYIDSEACFAETAALTLACRSD